MEDNPQAVVWDTAQVVSRFANLARLAQEEAQAQETLCQEALAWLCSRLRPVPDEGWTETAQAVIYSAAAAFAFYQYTLAEESTGREDVSLGDVKITQKTGASSSACRLWDQALQRAAPLLRDDRFYFEQVGKEKARDPKRID